MTRTQQTAAAQTRPATLITADFYVSNQGSLFLLYPLTTDASAWVEANLPDDAQTWGDAIVVEHRYIGAIVAGAQRDGLTVE